MPFPNFDPVLIHLGPFAVRWYALAYIAGILLGWRYCVGLIRKTELWAPRRPTATAVQIDDLILWLTLGVIVGGRLGYVLFYGRGEYAAHPLEIFQVWNGGMSFHGGFLGVAVAVIAFALANRIDILRLADLVAPCAPIGLFFGRLANFINGELWGRVTHVPWGMVFCSPHIIAANGGDCPAGVSPRHPSQLYEATLEGLVLFAILRWATHRARWLPRQGALTGLFMLCYGVFRIGLETVREPDYGMPDFPFGLTMGMILSTPMALIGAWLIWRALRRPIEVDPVEPEQPASSEPSGA